MLLRVNSHGAWLLPSSHDADGRPARPRDQTDLPWHLRGNWAPVLDERTDHDLRVDGMIPTELTGTYVRTGPNPASGRSDHWFFGDGMLHGVRLAGGKAEWYRNRFVQTPNITDPLDDPMATMGDLTRGTANTHVLATQR